MKYKDAVSYMCKCGRELSVPITSMQEKMMTAPSHEEMTKVQYMLTQEIIYHQNNNCGYMDSERKKAMLSVEPNTQ
tara:strand:- start:5229 stop:5456 length:228 start_codon:yes stop_codon:yes gene_type:complete